MLQNALPICSLFKDEVRRVGVELGIPKEMLFRHPFPGPGLGIRILGEITEEKVQLLQEADAIYTNGLKRASLYSSVWRSEEHTSEIQLLTYLHYICYKMLFLYVLYLKMK